MNDPQAAWREYFYTQHLPALAAQKIALYEWQIVANNILLTVVSVLTISGVILADVQLFWIRNILDKISSGQITLEDKKIQATSPFVGLLILIVSFSFFFVFINNVYTIRNALGQVEGDLSGADYASRPPARSGSTEP